MKTTTFKLALISACFALTVSACGTNRNDKGDADTDSVIMDTEGMSTDTMMMDTGTVPGRGTTPPMP